MSSSQKELNWQKKTESNKTDHANKVRKVFSIPCEAVGL